MNYSNAAAGWYLDPNDGRVQRYWDGSMWTGHTQAPPGVSVPSAPLTRREQKHRARIILAGVVGAVVLVVMAALAGRMGGTSSPSISDARYAQIRSTCEAQATASLPSGFVVGGNHWVDAVNKCMMELAVDTP